MNQTKANHFHSSFAIQQEEVIQKVVEKLYSQDSLKNIRSEEVDFVKREMSFFEPDQGGRRGRTGASISCGCEDRPEADNAEVVQKKHFQSSELRTKARSSVGERYIDTVEVDSSILSVPTNLRLSLGLTLIVRTMNLNPNRNLFGNLLADIFSTRVLALSSHSIFQV